MKISTSDYEYLERHINMFSERAGKEAMVDTRKNVVFVNDQFRSFIWLVFHKLNRSMAYLITDRLHASGLNDDHIETALKKILKEYK